MATETRDSRYGALAICRAYSFFDILKKDNLNFAKSKFFADYKCFTEAIASKPNPLKTRIETPIDQEPNLFPFSSKPNPLKTRIETKKEQ